jgi:aminocarboxymuconate-semialdehyde decarboxylase
MSLVIDMEHHVNVVTTQDSIKFMDENGIDMAIQTNHAAGSREVIREANDITAKAVKKYPKRYLGAATIPMIDGKPDLEEVDRAITGLGLHVLHVSTRPGDPGPLYVDSREMWPFYEKACKLNVPVEIQVTQEPGFEELKEPRYHLSYNLHLFFAREFDMASAVLRVCLGGVLEEFPDLKLIMDHFGGGVSAILDRLDMYWDGSEIIFVNPNRPGSRFYRNKPLITKPWREHFNKIYFGMAGRGAGMDAVKCALTNISPQKLMFATDWPFHGVQPDMAKRCIANIRKLDLAKEDIDGMLGENAAKLFGIKK